MNRATPVGIAGLGLMGNAVAERLGVADRGIREGILCSLIAGHGKSDRVRTEIRRR